MADPAHQQAQQSGSPHIVLLLSLKLILLAFFILMNALSEFETSRKTAVLESVNRAFRGSIQTPREAVSTDASLGLLPLPENLVNEVGSLFESFVPSARAKRTERATVMSVEMPDKAIFRPGEIGIRPERKILIRRLARAMMHEPGGVLKYELAFVHGIAGGDAGGDAGAEGAGQAERGRAVGRAEAISRYLIRQEIPPGILSIGVAPGEPGLVRFVLRMRDDALPPDDEAATREPAP